MNALADALIVSIAFRWKVKSLNAAEKFIVAELVRERRARLIGLVRQDLLSGINKTEQYEKLRLNLGAFPDESIDTSDHKEAAKAGKRSGERKS